MERQKRAQGLWNDSDCVLWEVKIIVPFAPPIELDKNTSTSWTLVPRLILARLPPDADWPAKPRAWKYHEDFET